ncbi:MAG: DUF5996 family protein [Planctomycetota bacterium]
MLPALPYADWKDTKQTLHLYTQIVGKVRMALMPPLNHWWHVPLYVTPRGLTTGPMPYEGRTIQTTFDFRDADVTTECSIGGYRTIDLGGKGTVAQFHKLYIENLSELGVDVDIVAKPYEAPWAPDTFAECTNTEGNDDLYISRWHRILCWIEQEFWKFRSADGIGFLGKATPPHLFWHSFDLALTLFSGRPSGKPAREYRNPQDAEAYSHEVISYGWWPGDDNVPDPHFYAYAAPVPDALKSVTLPLGKIGDDGTALLHWDEVRTADDPTATLQKFMTAFYEEATKAADWPELRRQSPFPPSPS